MGNFVGDDQLILNLEGLRFIRKTDLYGREYYLEWGYEGFRGITNYTVQEKRDEMFDRISHALIDNKNQEVISGVQSG